MRAILDICGWRKEIPMTESMYRVGYIEVPLFPPMTELLADADKVPTKETFIKVQLYHYGKMVGSAYLYEYDQNWRDYI